MIFNQKINIPCFSILMIPITLLFNTGKYESAGVIYSTFGLKEPSLLIN